MREDYKAIACIGRQDELGTNGGLIWKVKEDLRNFRRLTLMDVVVMGRKTWESLPKKPLPYRTNIVLTSDESYKAEGALTFTSVARIRGFIERNCKDQTIWIIGGRSIYEQFLPYCDTILLTEVDAIEPKADVYFPSFRDDFYEAWQSEKKAEGDLKYLYRCYRRLH